MSSSLVPRPAQAGSRLFDATQEARVMFKSAG